MPGTEQTFDLRSDEVQDIMSFVPHWMIRWGITLIFVIIIGLLAISWFIKYPEVIHGDLVLTTEIPPVKVVSKTNGTLEKLYVRDGQEVSEGDRIAIIQNPISLESIAFLKELLPEVELVLEGKKAPFKIVEGDLTFGEIQNALNILVKGMYNYDIFLRDDPFVQNAGTIKKQIHHQEKLKRITEDLLRLSEGELKMAEEKYQIKKELFEEGIIPKIEFFKEKEAFNQKKQEIEGIKKTIVHTDIAITENEKQEFDMEFKNREKKRLLLSQIQESFHTIQNYLNDWKQSYVVVAPIDGQISFLKMISEKAYIKADEEVFAVVPSDRNYKGLVDIPSQGFGKIRTGQQVRISLDNYPAYEYGQLEGRIEDISLMPNESKYRVKVNLPKGLVTHYKKTLGFKPEMKGLADIVTDDLRLSERILHQFRGMLTRKRTEKKKEEKDTEKSTEEA